VWINCIFSAHERARAKLNVASWPLGVFCTCISSSGEKMESLVFRY
jgi:hypothetical protein